MRQVGKELPARLGQRNAVIGRADTLHGDRKNRSDCTENSARHRQRQKHFEQGEAALAT